MKQKLMDLYFTEGADLTNRAVLVQAAADVGLDADDIARGARQRQGRRRRSSARRKRPRRPASRACRMFIFGGKFAVSGAQAPEYLADAIERVAQATAKRPNNSDHFQCASPPPSSTSARVPSSIEELDLCDPRDDELLVEVAASGMCATDLHGRDAYYPTQIPQGVRPRGRRHRARNRARGERLQARRPRGDGLSRGAANAPNCRSQRQTYCLSAFDLKMNGTRADGSTLHSRNGEPVYSAFFQQSSFGNFTIANERFAVKVRNDVPLATVARSPAAGRPAPAPCST